MKIKNLMFLTLIFILLFGLSFIVLAQRTEAAKAAEEFTASILNTVNPILDFLFGAHLDLQIISIALFIILAIMFADILISFSPLSRNGSIAIGILLAIIACIIQAPRAIGEWFLGVTAAIGVFSVFISLIIIFLVYLAVHVIIFKTVVPLFGKGKGLAELKIGVQGIREVAKAMRERK